MAILKNRRALPGLHLRHHKNTAENYTVTLPPPAIVKIPMQQHIGREAEVLVKPGEQVFVGTKIGDSDAPNGVPVHASVSGVVKAIEEMVNSVGRIVKTVVIESDGKQSPAPGLKPPSASGREEFIAAVRESGMVGLGGAGFPTHLKLAYKEIDRVDTLILNAAECEPYITADYRECMEAPDDIVAGIQLIMHHLNLTRCVIGIEKNKPEAIALLSKLTDPLQGVSVMALKSIYPQGAEKVLIYSVTGKILEEGMLPADCGVLVMNVSTVSGIARYLKDGMPLVAKRLTVDGTAVQNPQNLLVPVGTPVSEVLAFCGADIEQAKEILMGGPMMGTAVPDLSMPILKNNNAILAFLKPQASYNKTTACIRCGRCVRVCPVKLMPAALERAYDNRDKAALEALKVNLCINCGCCSYVCPARRDLAAKNQLGKQLLRELK